MTSTPFLQGTGLVWPKISGTKGRPPPAILLVKKLGSFMRYKNVGRSFFRFVTIYAFDRQTDEHLADGYTAAAFAAH